MALLLSAPLAGQVVADEPGCLLYQLVKNGDGEYFVFELYKDQCAAAPCSAPLGWPCSAPLGFRSTRQA